MATGDAFRKALWEEANRVIIDATYSGREHQAVGNRWEVINRWLGIPAVVASAFLAAGAAVSALTGGNDRTTQEFATVAAISLTGIQPLPHPSEELPRVVDGERGVAARPCS